jgi:hypothetical protein
MYTIEPDELALKAGDILHVLEKDRLSGREDDKSEEEEGWGRGYLESNPNQRGLFPLNYIQMVISPTELPPTALSLSSEMHQTVETLKEKQDEQITSSLSSINVKRRWRDGNDGGDKGSIVESKTNDMKIQKQYQRKEEDTSDITAPDSETKTSPALSSSSSSLSSSATTFVSPPDTSGFYDAYGNFVLPSGAYYAPDGTYYAASTEETAKDDDYSPADASTSSLVLAGTDERIKKHPSSENDNNGDEAEASSSSTSGYYDIYGNYVMPSGAYYAPDGTYYAASTEETAKDDDPDHEARVTTMCTVSSPTHDNDPWGAQRPDKGAMYPESDPKVSTSNMMADMSSVKQLKRQFDLAKEASARAEEARLKVHNRI